MRKFILSILILGILSSCSGEASYPKRVPGHAEAVYGDYEKAFGDAPMNIFSDKEEEQNIGISVNAYLWRATLSTVSFMPIISADPFGGVILTDWKTSVEDSNYRYKLNIYLMDRQLRADGVQVSVFKQAKDESGNWVDAEVDADMATKIEDAILTKARELKIKDSEKK